MDRELLSLQGRAGSAQEQPVAVNRALARFIAEKSAKLLS